MPSQDKADRSSGQDARDAVAEVLRHVEERNQRQKASGKGGAPRKDRPGARGVALAVVLLVILIWALVAPPAWIRPDPPPAPTPVELEDGLRMDMYGAALRITAFRDSVGRLPLSLFEALQDPGAEEDILYAPGPSGSFTLEGSRAGNEIRWRSDEGLSTLVQGVRQRVGGDGS